MNLDSVCITDPPDYITRYEPDDLPESLGDNFTLTAEDDAKIDRAAQWGRDLILAARAGSQQALQDLQQRMHIVRYETVRRVVCVNA